MKIKFFTYILNTVYPLKCEICGQAQPLGAEKRICPNCWDKIERINRQFCFRCGKTLQSETEFCLDCKDNEALFFGRIRAAGVYRQVLREGIHLFKYSGRTFLGRDLAMLLGDTFEKNFTLSLPDYLIPVPLYKKQKRKREYNQSEILAHYLGKKYGVTVLPKALERVKATAPQFELNKTQRRANIKNAFAVNRKTDFTGKQILLIDDICTTGSTINECARVLKESGAKEVNGLVLAHG